jgi:hypothetical protein
LPPASGQGLSTAVFREYRRSTLKLTAVGRPAYFTERQRSLAPFSRRIALHPGAVPFRHSASTCFAKPARAKRQ